jgi:hypothetical protein
MSALECPLHRLADEAAPPARPRDGVDSGHEILVDVYV